MNIARQYKLYRLGIEIPPTSLVIIKFVEGIFNELIVKKDDEYPDHVFYTHKQNCGIYMHDEKDGYLYCKFGGYFGELKHYYGLGYPEISELIQYMVAHHFNLNKIRPVIQELRHLASVKINPPTVIKLEF